MARNNNSGDTAAWAVMAMIAVTAISALLFWRTFVVVVRAAFAVQQAACDWVLRAIGQQDAGPVMRGLVTMAMVLAIDLVVAALSLFALQPSQVAAWLSASVILAVAVALVALVAERSASRATSPRWWE